MVCACNFRSSSLLLSPTSSSSSGFEPSRFPSKLRLSDQQKFKRSKHLGIRSASGSDENGSPATPDKLFRQEEIGAEYGEGFETFRPDGLLKDFLNNKLQEGFLKRIRYAMKPDEVYGLIFSWDNVLGRKFLKMLLCKDRWYLPVLIMYCVRFQNCQLSEPIEGLKEWLHVVYNANIPCAVVSSLDWRNLVEAMERMGLSKYFQAIVTEEDGMESIAHKFLSAAMKLDRKPSRCVVFEDDPRGVTAAHNCTMMAVGIIGAYPAYHLCQADLTVASLKELSVINIRRLFANKGSTFMEPQKEVVAKSPPKRKLRIDTIF